MGMDAQSFFACCRRLTLLSLVCCSACSSVASSVGTVNIERITAHWAKFADYEQQLQAESQRISASSLGADERNRQLSELQAKYGVLQNEITTDVRLAANKVAQAKGLSLIVTREFVGYGGRDVTPEVEQELGVVETPSPAPSPVLLSPQGQHR